MYVITIVTQLKQVECIKLKIEIFRNLKTFGKSPKRFVQYKTEMKYIWHAKLVPKSF